MKITKTTNCPKIERKTHCYLHWHQKRGVPKFQEHFQNVPFYIEPGTNTAKKTDRTEDDCRENTCNTTITVSETGSI